MRYDLKHIMPDPYEFKPAAYTDAEVLALWPRMAAELTGFADHLAANAAAITAGQVRIAVWLAERQYRAIQAGAMACPRCHSATAMTCRCQACGHYWSESAVEPAKGGRS
jgi:hypothetical protein